MTVARVVYKNKSGWKTGKNAFVKATDLETIEAFAKKQARGREYVVQVQDTENAQRFAPYAQDIEA